MAMVILYALVKIFSVSPMQDFFSVMVVLVVCDCCSGRYGCGDCLHVGDLLKPEVGIR